MVLLHALEHRRTLTWVTQDGDVIADVRATTGQLAALVSALTGFGFECDMSPHGIAHRYVRPAEPRPVVIDLLGPDGVGHRQRLLTTPPGYTLEVPGGTQALVRTEWIELAHGERNGRIPRPSLLGAIVVKACAAAQLADRSKHTRDLAFLLSLVDDPMAMREQLDRKDRQRLGAVRGLEDDRAEVWRLLGEHGTNGHAALGFLLS